VRRGQWLWLAGVFAGAGFAIWSLVWWRSWDSRLSADRAARALRATLQTRWTFTCTREENGGTVSLNDVDYFCQSSDPIQDGYWIGTNAHRITQLLPSG
jgi:hypothetical protein